MDGQWAWNGQSLYIWEKRLVIDPFIWCTGVISEHELAAITSGPNRLVYRRSIHLMQCYIDVFQS